MHCNKMSKYEISKIFYGTIYLVIQDYRSRVQCMFKFNQNKGTDILARYLTLPLYGFAPTAN